MSDLFHSSKYSIARAEQHIPDFERQVVEFFKTDLYAKVVETDPDTGHEVHKLKLIKPLPVALEGIAVDAVNNLRSSLDQVMYALRPSTGGRFAYFPFANEATNFGNAVNGRCKHLPQEIRDLIRAFKPYKGGDNLLWALNELCNTNKHGIICAAAIAGNTLNVSRATFHGGGPIFRAPVWDRAKNEMELFRRNPGGTYEANFSVTTFVMISGIELVDGQPAIAVFHNFARIVERIVMAIEAEARRLGLV